MFTSEETARIGRFVLVGIAATATHLSVAMSLNFLSALPEVAIHICAYLTAFSISFFGHYFYTFRSSRQWQHALVRFLAISLVTLLLSSLIVKLCTLAGFASVISLLVAAASVPAVSYVLNKKLAF